MKQLRQVFACIAFVLILCGGKGAAAQTLTRVYVQAGAGGFAANGATDTALDLRKALQGKSRTLQVVDSPDAADVIVRIDSRNERKETSSVTTYANDSKNGKSSTATTVPSVRTVNVIHATLVAGEFQMPLERESPLSWRLAASDIASDVDHWVKENYAHLLETRMQHRPAPSPTGPVQQAPPPSPASPQTDSASIAPGMSEQQVADIMGPPDKKVAFGPKSMWNYRGMQVVFENGKVADVKF